MTGHHHPDELLPQSASSTRAAFPVDAGAVPAGWFADPWSPGSLRYWDGSAWTGHVHDPSAPSAAAADPTMRWILPVGRSGWAIAAGYLGLFAVTCLLAPVALVVGAYALVDLHHHPEKLGRGRAVFGLVMGGCFTFLLVLGLIS